MSFEDARNVWLQKPLFNSTQKIAEREASLEESSICSNVWEEIVKNKGRLNIEGFEIYTLAQLEKILPNNEPEKLKEETLETLLMIAKKYSKLKEVVQFIFNYLPQTEKFPGKARFIAEVKSATQYLEGSAITSDLLCINQTIEARYVNQWIKLLKKTKNDLGAGQNSESTFTKWQDRIRQSLTSSSVIPESEKDFLFEILVRHRSLGNALLTQSVLKRANASDYLSHDFQKHFNLHDATDNCIFGTILFEAKVISSTKFLHYRRVNAVVDEIVSLIKSKQADPTQFDAPEKALIYYTFTNEQLQKMIIDRLKPRFYHLKSTRQHKQALIDKFIKLFTRTTKEFTNNSAQKMQLFSVPVLLSKDTNVVPILPSFNTSSPPPPPPPPSILPSPQPFTLNITKKPKHSLKEQERLRELVKKLGSDLYGDDSSLNYLWNEIGKRILGYKEKRMSVIHQSKEDLVKAVINVKEILKRENNQNEVGRKARYDELMKQYVSSKMQNVVFEEIETDKEIGDFVKEKYEKVIVPVLGLFIEKMQSNFDGDITRELKDIFLEMTSENDIPDERKSNVDKIVGEIQTILQPFARQALVKLFLQISANVRNNLINEFGYESKWVVKDSDQKKKNTEKKPREEFNKKIAHALGYLLILLKNKSNLTGEDAYTKFKGLIKEEDIHHFKDKKNQFIETEFKRVFLEKMLPCLRDEIAKTSNPVSEKANGFFKSATDSSTLSASSEGALQVENQLNL